VAGPARSDGPQSTGEGSALRGSADRDGGAAARRRPAHWVLRGDRRRQRPHDPRAVLSNRRDRRIAHALRRQVLARERCVVGEPPHHPSVSRCATRGSRRRRHGDGGRARPSAHAGRAVSARALCPFRKLALLLPFRLVCRGPLGSAWVLIAPLVGGACRRGTPVLPILSIVPRGGVDIIASGHAHLLDDVTCSSPYDLRGCERIGGRAWRPRAPRRRGTRVASIEAVDRTLRAPRRRGTRRGPGRRRAGPGACRATGVATTVPSPGGGDR